MAKLIGIYSKHNRLQVGLAVVLFTLCAWWSLFPFGFHLLDGLNLLITLFAGLATCNTARPKETST